jgi:hypothetical protein
MRSASKKIGPFGPLHVYILTYRFFTRPLLPGYKKIPDLLTGEIKTSGSREVHGCRLFISLLNIAVAYLWGKAIYITREQDGFFDVVEAEHFLRQTVYAETAAAVWWHAVLHSRNEMGKAGVVRVDASGLDLLYQAIVAVFPLGDGG